MSEFINNPSRRKEALKNVIRQLHEGKSVDEVKAEFAALLQGAGSAEITQVEQMLIAEGMPVGEIQRLCDVHTAVFRESLDQQADPATIPGHPIFTFLAENRLAEKVLGELEVAIEGYTLVPDEENRQKAVRQLALLQEYDRHYLRKENLLFPYLEKHGFTGPSRVMWGVQNDIRSAWKQLASLLETHSEANSVQRVFSQLATAIREMFYKEEKILFPAALEYLTEEEWLDIYHQEHETGYFFIKPETRWKDEVLKRKPDAARDLAMLAEAAVTKETQGLVPLKVGMLSAEQISLMLVNLPVDVTFVDENDEVRFFSQTPERIFQRDPAIIGRKVQNCHPPQSIATVQRILDDFRSGRKDVAEFWIQMQGKFIHIRYFALRDEKGAYRGTLEVSQEITNIRKLEGERRLLEY